MENGSTQYAFATAILAIVVPVVIYGAVHYGYIGGGSDGSDKKKSAFVKSFMESASENRPIRKEMSTIKIPEEDEILRDFARNVASNKSIYLCVIHKDKNSSATPHLSVTSVPDCIKGGSFKSEACKAAKRKFLHEWAHEIIENSDSKSEEEEADDVAFRSFFEMLTTGPGFDIVMECSKFPVFLQPRYVVVVNARKRTLHVATYAFVGTAQSIKGTGGPDSKYTPHVCRILTSNLFRAERKDVVLHVECADTAIQRTIDIARTDIRGTSSLWKTRALSCLS